MPNFGPGKLTSAAYPIMEITSTDPATSGLFNKLFLDYISGEPALAEFITGFPTPENIRRQLNDFSFSYLDRKALSNEIARQHSALAFSEATKANIDALTNENSYTVTTGHQLCLFTGPAYFIYKIISCIKICGRLNREIPGKKFIPVYWMATEDHDLEEIDHALFYGKKISWKITGKGRAGELTTEGIAESIGELKAILGSSQNAERIISLFERAYIENTSLAEATRFLVNEIFGKYGLLIVDGNADPLKAMFTGEIQHELLHQDSFRLVSSASTKLEALGYPVQVTPREINLFYAVKDSRERIVKEEGVFKVLNSTKTFSREEILREAERDPSAFSPNVVLRPLYQQKILPNIIYCGGPGEIAYWLQYKSFFDSEKIHFPFLVPRSFVLLFEKQYADRWKKLGFAVKEIFREEEHLVRDLVKRSSGEISLSGQKRAIEQIFSELSEEAERTDKSLVKLVAAEKQKVLHSVTAVESKLNKALRQKNETGISQVASIRSRAFPNGIFQERQENFFSFAVKSGPGLADELKDLLPDPMDGCTVTVVVI